MDMLFEEMDLKWVKIFFFFFFLFTLRFGVSEKTFIIFVFFKTHGMEFMAVIASNLKNWII